MSRRRAALLLLFLAVVVNLPLAHSTWTQRQVVSNVALGATLVADAVLLVILLLAWHAGGRRPLQAIALEGVQRCPPGVLMEQLHGDEYLLRGDVLERDRDRVVLDLGDRTVVVLLDGNANPVGYQQSAQVRARLL